jgi:S1-C subfamily serine protease
VRVETAPEVPARDPRTLAGQNPLGGASLVNLSPAVADQYGVDPFLKGPLVTAVGEGIAARAGFQPGDIIRSVNNRATNTVADLAAALAGANSWSMVIQRGDQQLTVQFG